MIEQVWEAINPESDNVMPSFLEIGNDFFVHYLHVDIP